MLVDAFPNFTVEDSWRALQSTIQLFSRLASQVSEKLGYEYPQALEKKVRAYVDVLCN
jgi:aminoglycoside 6-adenylyltransferase